MLYENKFQILFFAYIFIITHPFYGWQQSGIKSMGHRCKCHFKLASLYIRCTDAALNVYCIRSIQSPSNNDRREFSERKKSRISPKTETITWILYKDEQEVFTVALRAHASTPTPAFKKPHRKYNVTDTRYFLDDRHCTTASLTYDPREASTPVLFGRQLPDDGETRSDLPHLRLPVRVYWCATRSVRCPFSPLFLPFFPFPFPYKALRR